MSVKEVVIRLVLAIVIGGFIGYERQFKHRPAGFRTHILVCIGACVISMIEMYSVEETKNMILANPQLANVLKTDIGRLGAQVVSGIGFLGAGTIMHEKGSIKGLTTAASLWVVACIGLAIGLGYYYLSILSGVSVVITLVILKKFEARFLEKVNLYKIEIEYIGKKEIIQKVGGYFESKGIKIRNIEFLLEEEYENGPIYNKSLYTLLVPTHFKIRDIIEDLEAIGDITSVTIV